MSVIELNRHLQAEKGLSDQLKKYAGRWVAVRNHEVVADAETAAELLGKTEGQRIDRRFRVSETGSALL